MGKRFKWASLIIRCLPRVIRAYFSFVRPYSAHPERYPLEVRYEKSRKLVIYLLKKMKLNPLDYASNPETYAPLQCQGKLLVGNHLSFLDPLILIALSPSPIGFVAKKEAKKLPIAGKLITSIDGIFIDRNDPIATLRAFKGISKKIIDQKMGYAIFPEGTRNKFPYGMVGEFHPGAFKLAQMAGLDVQLVCLFGEQRVLEEKPMFRSYPIQFHRGELIPKEKIAEMGTSEFAPYVRGKIDNKVQEMIAKDQRYFEDGRQYKRAPKWWKPLPKKKEESLNQDETTPPKQ